MAEATTGVVLAGGKSRRMGTDKRFLELEGRPLIERALDLLDARCAEVLVSANDPERLAHLRRRVVPDRLGADGPLAGLHAGLEAASNDLVLFVPVDAPHVASSLLDRLEEEAAEGFDVVCGSTRKGVEPLVGYYRRRCVPAIEAAAKEGRLKVTDFFPHVRARVLTPAETAAADRPGGSYRNLNRPADLGATASRPGTGVA
ncbi:MAG TPA: molybdenum cofactor guanylyltransferase [Planctomycetota bacterium]|nr:molybdenum cofactor guanylyltransferase [Planctomycetota bacterium]